ncbi:MAG: RNase P subunit p30 family protein [Nanoarchaeota archaeon]
MFTDIVFPDKNEADFVAMAAKLGSGLLFVYENIDERGLLELKKSYPSARFGFLASNLNKLPKPGVFDILIGKQGREYIEHPRIKLIYGFETIEYKDRFHQRNSGLNEVLCKLARDKEKILAFDFSSLLRAKDKALVLGRMQQNARLMRKFKNEFVIASFARTHWEMRAGRDYKGLLEEVGVDGLQGKRAITLLDSISMS